MKRKEIFLGLIFIVMIAVFLSPLASPWPDGLESVAHNLGFVQRSEHETIVKAPIPDYLFPGLKNETLATVLAGITGTLLMFGIGYALARLMKKRKGNME